MRAEREVLFSLIGLGIATPPNHSNWSLQRLLAEARWPKLSYVADTLYTYPVFYTYISMTLTTCNSPTGRRLNANAKCHRPR